MEAKCPAIIPINIPVTFNFTTTKNNTEKIMVVRAFKKPLIEYFLLSPNPLAICINNEEKILNIIIINK